MPGESTDGDSEWFSADCKARLNDFLEANQDLLDFEWVSASDFTSMLSLPTKPVMQPPGPKAPVRVGSKPEQHLLEVGVVVETFLVKLSALVACATDVQFRPPKAGWDYGTLLGSLSLDEISDPQALFSDLMNCSVRTGKWGAFHLVPAVKFSQDGRNVEFEVDVLCSNQREGCLDYTKAASQIATYSLAVPGWGAASPLLLAA